MRLPFLEMEVPLLEMELSFLEMEVSGHEMEGFISSRERSGHGENLPNMKWKASFLDGKVPFLGEEVPFLSGEVPFLGKKRSISRNEAFHYTARRAKPHF
jgi:hypothetical protein